MARPDILVSDRELQVFQREVASWGREAIPAGSVHLAKLRQELGELESSPSDPMEMADVLLALFLHADEKNIDLLDAARRKFEIVKTRKYGMPDASGIAQHI